jgi:hypothetical protein
VTVGSVIVLLLVAVVSVALTLRRTELHGAAAVLRLLSLLFAVVAAAVLMGPVWADSGTFAIWALGLPVVVTLLPLLAAGARFGPAVTALAAVLLLAWALLAALGFGLFLLPAALAETAAAVAQLRPAAPDRGRGVGASRGA